MSSDSSTPNTFPNLSGGVPTHSQDLVASVVFTIAYACLLILAIYRCFHAASRSIILIRPIIFIFAQAVAYALRAVIANGNQSTKIYETSEILLLAGFTLICEPIPALLTRVLGKKGDGILRVTHMPLQQKLLGLLRIAVVVALILGIVAATSISDHESPSEISSIQHYREASAALIIVAMLGSVLIAGSIVHSGLLGSRAVTWMAIQTTLIIVSAIYKLASTIHPGGNFSVPAKIVFYVLNGAVQWTVGVVYFSVNLNDLFVQQATLDLEMAGPGQDGWTPNGQPYVVKAADFRQSGR